MGSAFAWSVRKRAFVLARLNCDFQSERVVPRRIDNKRCNFFWFGFNSPSEVWSVFGPRTPGEQRHRTTRGTLAAAECAACRNMGASSHQPGFVRSFGIMGVRGWTLGYL